MPSESFGIVNVDLCFEGKRTLEDILSDFPSKKLVKQNSFNEKNKELFDDKRFGNKSIHGDNLLALRSLYNSEIKGNVKLVYIDPPFAKDRVFKSNSNNSEVKQFSSNGEKAYEDSLVGAEYLSFLQKRLILLREIMAEDGVIYLHIDSEIGHYVKVLMDEVFGKDNFINDICRIKSNPKNFSRPAYGNIKDSIFFYSKGDDYVWNDPREDYSQEDIERLFPKTDEEGRRYTTHPLHAPGETEEGATGKSWKGMDPPEGRHWRYPPSKLTELDDNGLIEWSSNGNPRKIVYANEKISEGKKRQDVWEFKDPAYPNYPTQKNEDMLKTIIEASSCEGDLVMDCFAGSGTTLLAADQLNRNWIGIDKSDKAIETSLDRLKKEEASFSLYRIGEKE